MAPVTQRQLETGWLPDTPVEDTLLRRFVHNQADVNAVTAGALGGRHDRTDDVFLADAASPVPYFNQAILARPLTAAGDPVLDVIDGFFETGVHPATVLSIWPTPDLSSRGWSLVGHPAVVVRAPGSIDYEPPERVDVRVATSPEAFAAAEHVAVDGYPLDDARDLPVGSVFPPSLADTGLVVRLGLLHDETVGVGNQFTGHGLVNLCLAATLPAARRRGVWEALVWSRVGEAPDLPAIAYTSDYSRPGFIRMGFLPITRFTLWERPGRRVPDATASGCAAQRPAADSAIRSERASTEQRPRTRSEAGRHGQHQTPPGLGRVGATSGLSSGVHLGPCASVVAAGWLESCRARPWIPRCSTALLRVQSGVVGTSI